MAPCEGTAAASSSRTPARAAAAVATAGSSDSWVEVQRSRQQHCASPSHGQCDHPGGKLTKRLKDLRAVQVVVTVLFMVAAGAVLWNFRIAVKRMAENLRAYYSSELHSTSWAADADGGSRPAVATGVAVFTLCLVASLALALPSLCMDIVWLVLTASPRARARSCGGGRTACVQFTCDLAGDVAFALVWAAIVALCCTCSVVYPSTLIWVGVVLSLVLFALRIATAVLSGMVRRRMQAAAGAGDKGVGWLEMRARPGFSPGAISASII